MSYADPARAVAREARLQEELPRRERRCRDCGTTFITEMPDTNTKWTQLCSHCLRMHT